MALINGFHLRNVRGDVLGGLTAAVVALPLALAFGNISGVNQDVVENFIGRANVTNYEEANKFTKNIFNLVNKQLRQENGVQAKDDFDRFFKELPNINDPQETVKVMTDYLVQFKKWSKIQDEPFEYKIRLVNV